MDIRPFQGNRHLPSLRRSDWVHPEPRSFCSRIHPMLGSNGSVYAPDLLFWIGATPSGAVEPLTASVGPSFSP